MVTIPSKELLTMAPTIPEKFTPFRGLIEKKYHEDEKFREIYEDYLTYLKAHRFWSQSGSDVAHLRQSEYAGLVKELEEEWLNVLDAE
jgi:TRAP-type mannitol/chloroaromatic compound transport system substrate-binding protein